MKNSILIVDDEKNLRDGIEIFLRNEDFLTFTAKDGIDALEVLKKEDIDFLITDLRMDNMAGEELVQIVRKKYQKIPIVIITAHGDINIAVKSMKIGVVDFITKPINLDQLLAVINRNLETVNLKKRQELLEIELNELKSKNKTAILGKSESIKKISKIIESVAKSRATILITGESGVGKEVVADSIHITSDRANYPFIKVNCSALSESLLESELFGHEEGAFTGAIGRKKGRFELADRGTIFLDEIGEISQQIQVKILRVLQDRKIERVGGEKSLDIDVRIICATNRNLEEEIKKGNFREDLYYRLNVVNIEVPPLRERKDDIPLLATSFLKNFATENYKKIAGFDKSVLSTLLNYNWPGNIRELKNTIEHAVIFCDDKIIKLNHLPENIRQSYENLNDDKNIDIKIGTSLEESEKIVILKTLIACKNNKTKAAEILKITRKTLYDKMKIYNI